MSLPRTASSTSATARPEADRGARLGYRFSAVPRELLDAIEADAALPAPPRDLPDRERRRIQNDRLRSVDALVVAQLLKFRRRDQTSCWCAKETIASRIGKTTRTVQASLRRLELRGFIEQVAVATPDPDEPQNRTGWRITLLFVPGAQRTGRGPDRRPPEERRVWSRADAPAPESVSSPREETRPAAPAPVSSVRESAVSPPVEIPVSSNSRARFEVPDGSEQDGSSSLSARVAPAPPVAPKADDDRASLWGGRQEAVGAVQELLGAAVVQEVDTDGFGRKIEGRWDCLQAAAYMAKAKRGQVIKAPIPWLLTVVRDYASRGAIPVEAEQQRQKWLDAQRRNELARRAVAAAAVPAEPPLDIETEAAELRRRAECADLPEPLRRIAAANLARLMEQPAGGGAKGTQTGRSSATGPIGARALVHGRR